MRPQQAELSALRTDTIEVDHDTIVGFRKEAAKRGIPVNRLIKDLLGVIVTDKLTAAILDD